MQHRGGNSGGRGRRPERPRRLTAAEQAANAREQDRKAAIELEPQRTCIVTKEQLPPARMLRLAWNEDTLIAGPKGGGRGAYIKVDRKVFEQLDQKVISRAFRTQVSKFDRATFLNDLHAIAQKRVLEALGLARRMGILVVGTERVPEQDVSNGLLIVADDLAERSKQKLGERSFLTGAQIGAALGMGYVGAAFIPGKSHHITNEAAYWLAIWYESGPAERQNEASHG